MLRPFYDPEKSYEENYERGPFGIFSNGEIFTVAKQPAFSVHGKKLHSKFGIPPGPLINSNFVAAAFQKGFDICVYKTVRSESYPSHPFPNVLAVHPAGDLTMDIAKKPLIADNDYVEPLSITNSFGVPSKNPDVWQEDVKKALKSQGEGQLLILSFMGTIKEGQTEKEFIQNHVDAARLSKETGAEILEVNLSCPNIGNEGLICYDLSATKKICQAIKSEIGNTPLVIKIGYFDDDEELKKLAEIANEYADDVSAINTLQATIVDKQGSQILPGKNRAKSGVCGASIKWAGIDMVRRLKKIKNDNEYKFSITGIGGVITPGDFNDYITAGSDAVMSATGAMWNPYLAQEIKANL
ncbi:MAG: hypothetical protein A2826_02170 [Candidatus Doudnabacteria bacterium RIFCSPHIGHO2_01_FULL_43_23]|uniref:Dihydroorotate dehydrogenase catalytic domain-containing protein n=1 Tax=Candidatus Doudnabacteria bacterium RIFCSPHIGHO2_01_FULL_43_23 TaxID=1817822 RepID=A0A1F5NUJ7_9BACT|nr:MAG: hypothetical protein A2826_02170 [Candidatus Doudnabacteria bacterium RIFCSPHIGHO2_01_FULL_43_23]